MLTAKEEGLKYLQRRMRTIYEVMMHLREKGYEDVEISKAVKEMYDLQLLDDAAYCASYAEYAVSRGRGQNRLFQDLRRKGVAKETIEAAIEPYRESEHDRAMEQAVKLTQGMDIDSKVMGHVSRRLNTLGYTGDVVYQVIGELLKGK